MTIRYLTVDELVYINDNLPVLQPIHKILRGKDKVRDMDLLEAAAGRPMQSVFGTDAYLTLEEKAAALLHSIARNHPFADGNKRTATIAALFMLDVNGRRAQWDEDEALERIIEVAEGRTSLDEFAAWLRTTDGEPALESDGARDMEIIQRIMTEHVSLLDRLAAR